MDEQVTWILELTIKPDQLDTVIALADEMVSATKANEPDTLAYQWFIDDDGTKCHLYERYADSAAALVHIENFGEQFAERFMAAMAPERMVIYGDPNDEVMQALSVLGPTVMALISGYSR